MSKFGELIDVEIPVLLEFFTQWDETSNEMHPVIKDVAAAIGDKAKVIKIDVDKNPGVASKYQVKGVPTLMIFKSGVQLWRQSGESSAHDLKAILSQYL